METPLRILRARVDKVLGRPPLSDKQREREERILAGAQPLIGSQKGNVLTIGKLARALGMTPAAIRWHFLDIESILAEILMRHLAEISQAIGKIPHDHPNLAAARRAAYLAVTRTEQGGFSEPHLLLVHERYRLPQDLAKPVEDMRRVIGELVGGKNGATALTLLDAPKFPVEGIEPMLASLEASGAAPATQARPPAQTRPTAKPGNRKWLH